MKKILVVDDDKVFGKLLKSAMQSRCKADVYVAYSAKEALSLLKDNEFDMFLIDLVLPDSEGKLVEILVEAQKDVIVITADEELTIAEKFSKLNIIDYIIKVDGNIENIVNAISTIEKNKKRDILIVDDSLVIRNNLKKELLKHKFNLFEAKDGQEALNFLKNKSVDLIITDYEMPNLDGLGLLKEIRKEKDKNILPIIALSSINNSAVVSRLLKNGANDYLTKPYSKDELMCRVNNAITNKELYEEIKQIATIDPLTKVYNRNYFYEASEQIFANAKRYNEDLSVAILDIDHFKKINDTYGHDVGDIVLKSVAKKMKKRLRGSDLLVRYGGEEFIILLPNTSLKKSFIAMEGLRETISKNKVEIDGEKIVVTVSIGISDIKDTNSLDEAIKRADLKLYKAKNNGRDRVEF